MTRTRAILPSLALLALAACGGSKSFTVSQAPKEPFKAFGAFEVQQFAIDGVNEMDEKTRDKAHEMAALISFELNDRLKSSGWFERGGRKLTIQGKLIGFNPGSQAARYFLGMGAGKGEIVAEVIFKDEEGRDVARGVALGTVSGGWYGGSLKSAGKRLARAIVNFIEDNYDGVSPP